MKYSIIALMAFVFSFSIESTYAQGANKYVVGSLPQDINIIIENVRQECNLNPEQLKKFKNDYVLFLNENAKPNANTQALFLLLGTKVRGYLNDAQFSKVTKMAQDGRLTPKDTPVSTTVKQDSKPAPAQTSLLAPSVSNQSNVALLFEQLQSYMKITPEKSSQIIPILKDYDVQLTKIKTENAGNAAKIKQLTDALNGQTIPKLKAHMTDQQIGTLVVALGMQENILSGKNLSADQKVFLDKIRNQYGLNDVQTMSVILVLVQGKIRGDAIAALHKTDPQKAGQEFITMMQDLDGQLKSSLTNDQYTKIKSDIEKLLKGQKL